MEEKDNVPPAGAVQEAEACEGSGTAAPCGKFKSVDALLHAYNSLEEEFTRRSQRLRELEGKFAAGGRGGAKGRAKPRARRRGAGRRRRGRGHVPRRGRWSGARSNMAAAHRGGSRARPSRRTRRSVPVRRRRACWRAGARSRSRRRGACAPSARRATSRASCSTKTEINKQGDTSWLR